MAGQCLPLRPVRLDVPERKIRMGNSQHVPIRRYHGEKILSDGAVVTVERDHINVLSAASRKETCQPCRAVWQADRCGREHDGIGIDLQKDGSRVVNHGQHGAHVPAPVPWILHFVSYRPILDAGACICADGADIIVPVTHIRRRSACARVAYGWLIGLRGRPGRSFLREQRRYPRCEPVHTGNTGRGLRS